MEHTHVKTTKNIYKGAAEKPNVGLCFTCTPV